MAKKKVVFVCSECGEEHPKWAGQCVSCKEWNTLQEFNVGGTKNEVRASKAKGYAGSASARRVKLKEVEVTNEKRVSTGFKELDRVLGSGIMPGSSLLIGGNPGAGKSTLLLQAVERMIELRPLYATGEESLSQVASRAERLGLKDAGEIDMMSETNVNNILESAAEAKPGILIVDSIQSVFSPESESAPGSTSQIRDCAGIITQYAKQSGCAVIMIGHVNKDSTLAGPKVLEHIVDGVFELESTSDSRFRMLRSLKNRFGPVNELGCFAMMAEGLREVSNPSAIFLSRPEGDVSGSAVCVLWEGTRPLLIEVQVLADDDASSGNPRRVSIGVDNNRIAMLLAIMSRHSGLSAAGTDVYINIVGGLRVMETSIDLAVICGYISSLRDRPLPKDLVIIGELGLSGELRPVPQGPERIREAAKHGFKKAIVPKSNGIRNKDIQEMTVYPVNTITEATEIIESLS